MSDIERVVEYKAKITELEAKVERLKKQIYDLTDRY